MTEWTHYHEWPSNGTNCSVSITAARTRRRVGREGTEKGEDENKEDKVEEEEKSRRRSSKRQNKCPVFCFLKPMSAIRPIKLVGLYTGRT